MNSADPAGPSGSPRAQNPEIPAAAMLAIGDDVQKDSRLYQILFLLAQF
jgi:hypothetical protein